MAAKSNGNNGNKRKPPKRGKTAQQKFLRDIRFPIKRKKKETVQHPRVRPKRKII